MLQRTTPYALPEGGVPLTCSPELFASRRDAGTATVRLHGRVFTIRPVLPTDVAALDRFFRRLSAPSRFWRFNAPVARLTAAQLEGMVDVDHDRRETLLALDDDAVVAVAQYLETAAGDDGGRRGELAIVVADTWQRLGLGRRLLAGLLELAAQRGFVALDAHVHLENRAVTALLRSLDVPLQMVRAGAEATATLHLRVEDLADELAGERVSAPGHA